MVEPDVIAEDPELHAKFVAATEAAVSAYTELLEGLEKKFADVEHATLRRKQARQAARAVLPNATETRIVVTGNYRAWRHFIAMRASEHADVEIRALAIACLRELQRIAPNAFADFEITRAARRHRGRIEPVRQRRLTRTSDACLRRACRDARGRPFGRLLTAMVTPVRRLRRARPRHGRRAGHLPRRRAGQRRAGDQRDDRRVADHDRRREGRPGAPPWSTRSGDRAHVVAGVGTFDTVHTDPPGRAGGEGRRARAARRHAVLLQAAAGRAARPLPRGRRRDRPAGRCSTTSRAATAIADRDRDA